MISKEKKKIDILLLLKYTFLAIMAINVRTPNVEDSSVWSVKTYYTQLVVWSVSAKSITPRIIMKHQSALCSYFWSLKTQNTEKEDSAAEWLLEIRSCFSAAWNSAHREESVQQRTIKNSHSLPWYTGSTKLEEENCYKDMIVKTFLLWFFFLKFRLQVCIAWSQ